MDYKIIDMESIDDNAFGEMIRNSSSWTTTEMLPLEQAVERYAVDAASNARLYNSEGAPRYVLGVDPFNMDTTTTATVTVGGPGVHGLWHAMSNTTTVPYTPSNFIGFSQRPEFVMHTGAAGMEMFRQAIAGDVNRRSEETPPAPPVLDQEYKVTISSTKLTVESDDEMFFLDVHDANKNLRRFKSEVNGFFRDKNIPFKLTVFNGE